MSAAWNRCRARAVLVLGLAFGAAGCGRANESCSSAHLDFALATPDDELDVVVVACSDRVTQRHPSVVGVLVELDPDAEPHEPVAIAVDVSNVDVYSGSPPYLGNSLWHKHTEHYLEERGCSTVTRIRLSRLDDGDQTALSGSLEAVLDTRPEASCSVSIEAQ